MDGKIKKQTIKSAKTLYNDILDKSCCEIRESDLCLLHELKKFIFEIDPEFDFGSFNAGSCLIMEYPKKQ